MTIPENGTETFWNCVEQAADAEDYEALQACQNLNETTAPAEPVISLESGFDGAPGSGSKDDPFQISVGESGEGFQYLTTWSITDPDDDVTFFVQSPYLEEKHTLPGLFKNQSDTIWWTHPDIEVACKSTLNESFSGFNPPASGSFKRLCRNKTETLESGSYKWTFNAILTESGQVIDPTPTVYFDVTAPAEPVISLESGFDGAPGSGSKDDPFQISVGESGEGFQYLTTWSITDPDDDVTFFVQSPYLEEKHTLPGLFKNQSDTIWWTHPDIEVACKSTLNESFSGFNPPASGSFKRLCRNKTETLESGSYKWTFNAILTESGQVIDPTPTVYFDVTAPAKPGDRANDDRSTGGTRR